MGLLLRTVRHSRWLKDSARPWLERGDVPADSLADLPTTDQTLSVWSIESDRANLERVVRAVAVGKQKLDHSGWVLFDSAILEPLGIGLVEVEGRSKDKGANSWHRDLVDLSGLKLVGLARGILLNGECGVVLKKRMAALILAGIEANHLPPDTLKRLQ